MRNYVVTMLVNGTVRPEPVEGQSRKVTDEANVDRSGFQT